MKRCRPAEEPLLRGSASAPQGWKLGWMRGLVHVPCTLPERPGCWELGFLREAREVQPLAGCAHCSGLQAASSRMAGPWESPKGGEWGLLLPGPRTSTTQPYTQARAFPECPQGWQSRKKASSFPRGGNHQPGKALRNPSAQGAGRSSTALLSEKRGRPDTLSRGGPVRQRLEEAWPSARRPNQSFRFLRHYRRPRRAASLFLLIAAYSNSCVPAKSCPWQRCCPLPSEFMNI